MKPPVQEVFGYIHLDADGRITNRETLPVFTGKDNGFDPVQVDGRPAWRMMPSGLILTEWAQVRALLKANGCPLW